MGNRTSNGWFRPKRIGRGWTPASWQGWAVTAAAVVVIVLLSVLLTAR